VTLERRSPGSVRRGLTMARSVPLVLALCLLVVGSLPRSVGAADWGTIVPGTSTKEGVRARYGEPTTTSPVKVEGYDTMEWVYEGDKAPRGIRRLTVEFGLLTGTVYRPEVVRLFRLDPVPRVFNRQTILAGWGLPSRLGKDNDAEIFFYEEGLIVKFDQDRWAVVDMVFTPPQPESSPPK
jgi:hypothetical protein